MMINSNCYQEMPWPLSKMAKKGIILIKTEGYMGFPRYFILHSCFLKLDLYSAGSLKQQSAGSHVAPYGYIILMLR